LATDKGDETLEMEHRRIICETLAVKAAWLAGGSFGYTLMVWEWH